MKFVFQGTTRIVILTKKYAIKIPRLNFLKDEWSNRFIQGWLSNKIEYTNSPHLSCVAPVLKSYLGGLIIVMKRCKTFSKEEREEFHSDINKEKIDKIIQEISQVPYYHTDKNLMDFYYDYHNFGVLDGRLVLIDYGLSFRYI